MGIAIDEMELLTDLSRMDRFDGNTVSDIKAVVDSHGRKKERRLIEISQAICWQNSKLGNKCRTRTGQRGIAQELLESGNERALITAHNVAVRQRRRKAS